LTMADGHVAQPSLQRSYLVPSTVTAKPGEAEALEVLAQVLGAGETCRLYRELVVEKRIASSAGGWYLGTSLDDTRFGVSATPLPGVTFATVEAAIDAAIAEIAEHGVTAEEFERARTRLIADTVYAQDNQATMAQWYGEALASGENVERVGSWTSRLRAVTPEAVQNAARTWLDKRRSVTGYLVKELPGNQEKRS
jgi:zinc protease